MLDDLFLLFMLIAFVFSLYFFMFNRQRKSAITALGVAIASFILFGLANDQADIVAAEKNEMHTTMHAESYKQDRKMKNWSHCHRKKSRH